MATRNIEMNYYNGSSYDQLYPKTTPSQAGAADRNYMQSCVFGVSSTASSDWIEVGRQNTNRTYISARTTFSISGVNGRHAGILTFSLRVDGTANVMGGNTNLYWLALNDDSLRTSFAIEQGPTEAIMYLKLSGSYQCYHIGILDYAYGSEEFTDPTNSNLFQLKSNYNLSGNHKSSITAKFTSGWGTSGIYSMVYGCGSLTHSNIATGDQLLIGDVSSSLGKKISLDEFTQYCPTTTSARTRPIQISTTDLTPSSSNLSTGQVYLVYE